MWETRNGDTEIYTCHLHAGPSTCHISGAEDCKFYHIEREDEAWCKHPELDLTVNEEYCPLIVDYILEDQDF